MYACCFIILIPFLVQVKILTKAKSLLHKCAISHRERVRPQLRERCMNL